MSWLREPVNGSRTCIHAQYGNSVCPFAGYFPESRTPSIASTGSATLLTGETYEALIIMKLSSLALVVLAGMGGQVYADETQATVATQSAAVETYTYGATLDVKKVIAITPAADQCGAVPVRMTYEDSQGQRHILQYQVMGSGCSNG